ncbi:MAG: plastocyanin/azurin family copper-binding protein [Haloarculaceae archaeon]
MKRRTFLGGVAGGGFGSLATSGRTATDGQRARVAGTAAATSDSGTTHTVSMVTDGGDYYFDPIGLHVQPGDTVEFVVESGGHSATSYSTDNPGASTRRIPEGAKSFNSGVLKNEDASFTHTFETNGTYDYYCIPHKQLGMVGRIVCGEPGGPAEESSIPDAPGSGVMPPSDAIVEAGSLSYPFVPKSDVPKGLPPLFWIGGTFFAAAATYMLSKYDRESGRYTEDHADGAQ